MTGTVGEFDVTLHPTKDTWVNWKGNVPGTQDERYPFHGVTFSRKGFSITAYAVYPYHDTSGYFYPRSNKAGLNHAPHTMDSFRYNEEGGDYRLVDTDERMSPSNVSIYFCCECTNTSATSTARCNCSAYPRVDNISQHFFASSSSTPQHQFLSSKLEILLK